MWRSAIICAVVLLPGPAQASSILVNGGFEQSLGMPSNGELVAGSTALPGWTISGTSTASNVVDWLGPGGGGPAFNIEDGTHAIDLDGRGSLYGAVSQEFATTVGQSYDVAFDLSGNPGDAPSNGLPRVKLVRVTAGGFSQDYLFDTTGMTPLTIVWQPIAFSFMASSLTTTLSFTSLTGAPNDYGAMIDNVRVTPTPVPEPTSVLLLSCGLVACARRRVARFLRSR